MFADCLSRLVDKKLNDHDYEPKGQKFGCTIFEDLCPILNNGHNHRNKHHRPHSRQTKSEGTTNKRCIL